MPVGKVYPGATEPGGGCHCATPYRKPFPGTPVGEDGVKMVVLASWKVHWYKYLRYRDRHGQARFRFLALSGDMKCFVNQ